MFLNKVIIGATLEILESVVIVLCVIFFFFLMFNWGKYLIVC